MAYNGFALQITVTASAVQVSSNQVFNSITLTAKSTNTGAVAIGFSSAATTGNSYLLEKGTSVTLKVPNTNALYIVGTANDILSIVGS